MQLTGLLRPLPRRTSRLLTVFVLAVWPLQMAWLAYGAYLRPRAALAGDLAGYGTSARWKGIYYRGEKIGFSVAETIPEADGYELREDSRIQMALIGTTSAAQIRTSARVDASFALRSFHFSLDPGTGPLTIDGTIDGKRLVLELGTSAGKRTETRDLPEPPILSLNLPRRLAAEGLSTGKKFEFRVFDPATLQNAPMHVDVLAREIVSAAGRPVPAFRVETRFSGITALAWITDVGEIVREESPTGFIVALETRDRAMARAVPGEMQLDILEAVAIKPQMQRPIEDPRGVLRLRLRLEGIPLEGADLQGVGQRLGENGEIELSSSEDEPDALDMTALQYLKPEPLIESDAPEIRAEAEKAVAGAKDPRERALRLTRHVSALLDKKPTMSLPSAREVLRTKVGDCNEHTALYVALARSINLPARIAVGVVYMRGAFYYHAWPEVYVETGGARGKWIAADPTLNEFPANPTHLRLVRGGLDRQTAVLPLIGRAKIAVLDVQMDPQFTPVLVGAEQAAPPPFALPLPSRTGGGNSCWSRPIP